MIPLLNIPLVEFSRRLFISGGVSLKGLLMLPLYYLQIIPAIPFAVLQQLIFGKSIRLTNLDKDPIFILGHYRTGTTLLQKLLASDKRFGTLTNYDSMFPSINLLMGKRGQKILQRIIQLLKIKNPFFHNSMVLLGEPAEEDDCLMNRASAYSAYWGLVFPRKWKEWLNGSAQISKNEYVEGWRMEYLRLIQYATYRNEGRQLVLKNPPGTERIGLLLSLFPNAKFIYLYRNPYHLYYSVKNMWHKAILRYYSLQKLTEEEQDELIFGHFNYLTSKYEEQKMRIPDGNLIEISYEELMQYPFATVRKIYTKFGLPAFEDTSEDLRAQLKVEREYKSFEYSYDADTLKKIKAHWGRFANKYQYTEPEMEGMPLQDSLTESGGSPKSMPAVIWLTGLSGSGKTTIAHELAGMFAHKQVHPVILDGDEIRAKLNLTAFDEESRKRHILYVGYLASVLEKEGRVVIVALISPYAETRDKVRQMCNRFVEVYVSTSLEVCMKRDTRGLYARAIKGEIPDFTGISAPYYPPLKPEVTIDNGKLSSRESAQMIFNLFQTKFPASPANNV